MKLTATEWMAQWDHRVVKRDRLNSLKEKADAIKEIQRLATLGGMCLDPLILDYKTKLAKEANSIIKTHIYMTNIKHLIMSAWGGFGPQPEDFCTEAEVLFLPHFKQKRGEA